MGTVIASTVGELYGAVADPSVERVIISSLGSPYHLVDTLNVLQTIALVAEEDAQIELTAAGQDFKHGENLKG